VVRFSQPAWAAPRFSHALLSGVKASLSARPPATPPWTMSNASAANPPNASWKPPPAPWTTSPPPSATPTPPRSDGSSRPGPG